MASLLAVAATLVSAFLGSFVYRYWFDRVKKKRVQKALETELRENSGLSKLVNIHGSYKSTGSYSPGSIPEIELSFLSANLQKLGLLDKDQLNSLMSLREDIKHHNYIRTRVNEGEDWSRKSENGDKTIAEGYRQTVENIVITRGKLIEELSEK